jgi:NADH-quinone oxidoreductase subunit N
MLEIDYHAIAPELITTGVLLAVLVVDLFLPMRLKFINPLLSLVGIGAAAVAVGTLIGEDRTTFGGAFVVDRYAILFKFLFLGATALTILVSANHMRETEGNSQGEFHFLVMSSLLGMMVLPSARELITLFIALEAISIPGFVLSGFRRRETEGGEAAIKFFLIGVLSTAIMLFGMSMLYGMTGSTVMGQIADRLPLVPGFAQPLVFACILLVVAGFAFKVSAVPFHFWAPDTYEGAPVPVAAFLSVASKAAGFAGLLQVCFLAFPAYGHVWAPGFAILSVVTMTVGNITALNQTNVVRLLAYSSIAQAGYILLPFAVIAGQPAAVQQDAFAAALTYLLIYSVMNLGAFAVIIPVGKTIGHDVSDFDGLARRKPALAMAMMFFLLSLAGMIPTAGFWAKFFVFRVSLEADVIWIAAVMVVNTVIGLYYYLSLAGRMYLREPSDERGVSVAAPLGAAIAVMAIVIAILTVYPDFFNTFSPRSTLVAG